MTKEQSVFSYSLAEVILVSAIIIGLNIAGVYVKEWQNLTVK